jgi:cytoskeletal protein RodZ
MYKNLSWYNRQRLIQANRPFGKDGREFKKILIWLLAVFAIGMLGVWLWTKWQK